VQDVPTGDDLAPNAGLAESRYSAVAVCDVEALVQVQRVTGRYVCLS
jgi:hypothetical protein